MHRPLPSLFLALLLWTLLGIVSQAGVERVSVAADGQPRPGNSREPSMSADGRYVAFSTTARLTRDDRNSLSDVYVRDRINKTTRRVTDDRGGDQPAISANGRFVVFRALDGLTRVRIVDLERGGIPVAAAIPNDSSNYDRPSDSAVVSPDGAFVAYAFRPTPELTAPDASTRGHQVMVTDLMTQSFGPSGGRVVPNGTSNPAVSIPDLGRVAMSFDGELVVFESKAPLKDDANSASDIYLMHRSDPNSLQRISKATAPVADLGTSHDPVISQDGTRIFFISDQPLLPGDPQGRATIYMASSADGFSALTPLSTAAVPTSLSTQATISGTHLAFLGKPAGKLPRAVVRAVDSNAEITVPIGALVPTAAPVLNGDSTRIAFTALSGGANQVYVAAVPGMTARVAPVVTLTPTVTNGELTITENGSYNVAASATSPDGGTIRLKKIELDGREKSRATSTIFTTFSASSVARDIYGVKARAFNDAWIEGIASLRVVAKPASNLVAVTGAVSVTQSAPQADGRVNFTAVLRVDNTRTAATGPLRIVLTQAATPAVITEAAASFSEVPPAEENVFDLIPFPALEANTAGQMAVTGHTLPTATLEEGYKGRGWTVFAAITEQQSPPNGPYTALSDSARLASVLLTLPRLNENTNLPNGGTPVPGTPQADSTFNPSILQSIDVTGKARVGGPSRASYSARANFNTGSRPCLPAWSLVNADGMASISDAGVLTVGAITAARKIMIRAHLFDESKDRLLPVTIFPLPPTLLVRARGAAPAEGGANGEFLISRTGSKAADLAVSYAMEGTATNGADYTALPGAVTIPAGASSVSLPIVPVDDMELEGVETIRLRLLLDAAYRLGGIPTAKMILSDNEPLPVDQPDLTLRRGAAAPIGALTYQKDFYDGEETKQTVVANGLKNRKEKIVASIYNRGVSAQDFHLQGSPASRGYTIQYLSGTLDVTDAVIAGTFTLPGVEPGMQASITVAITPTVDAGIGSTVECLLRAVSDAGSGDVAEIAVTRVR